MSRWGRRLTRFLGLLACALLVLTGSTVVAQAEPLPSLTNPPSVDPAQVSPPDGGPGCDDVPPVLFLEKTCDLGSTIVDVVTNPTEAISNAGAAIGGATVEAITKWVADSAVWLLSQVAGLIDRATSPQLEADWFLAHYRVMAGLAAMVLLPLLFMSVISAVIRQDAGQMLRSFFGYLPLAAILTGVAITAVSLSLSATDAMTGWVADGVGANTTTFVSNVSEPFAKLGATPGGTIPLFALFVGAIIAIAGAVIVWLELLMRAAAIYVAVLFLPLALAGIVWPATAHWAKRLTHILGALILSKFVIAAVFSLAAAGLSAGTEGAGFGAVLLGGALLLMAAMCPFVLLHFAPVLEAGAVGALEGRGRRAGQVATGGTMSMYRHASSSAARDGAYRLPVYDGRAAAVASGGAAALGIRPGGGTGERSPFGEGGGARSVTGAGGSTGASVSGQPALSPGTAPSGRARPPGPPTVAPLPPSPPPIPNRGPDGRQ